MAKKYKCPYCEKRLIRKDLINHIDRRHEELIPQDYTSARVVYDMVNKVSHGTCRVCGKPTKWNEKSGRYDVLCGNPKCKQHMRDEYKKNMLRVRGTYNILNDPEQQKIMLANRKISGSYTFSDGGILTYTGSYEKNCLEFMDVVMQISSKDILSPGPTLEYEYNGEKHFYITDFYYIPYNLIIEVKDGGDNPNNKSTPGMISSREKTIEKERLITDRGDYNYIRLTNNNFAQLLDIFMVIKQRLLEGDDNKVIKINESTSILNNYFTEFHQREYYRVTYDGIGIYEALRNNVTRDEWIDILKSDRITWLPKPPNYEFNNRSYFTKTGYDTFVKKALPLIKKYLNPKKIKVEQCIIVGDIVYEDKYQIVVNVSNTESYISEGKYDPPYSSKQIKDKYGESIYNKLIQDPAHKYRMDTGIELIHKEPSKKELERIWKNWNLMTPEQKSESDKKSIELFGKTNKKHYEELILVYNESTSILNNYFTETYISESEEYKFDNQKTDNALLGIDVSIISGDAFDSEITHHIENFDKKTYEIMMESNNIVKDYNDYTSLKINEAINSKTSNVAIFQTMKMYMNGYLEQYAKANDKKDWQSIGINNEEDLKKYVISGFINTPPKDPSVIKKLLDMRLEYVNSTIRLLKDMIQNNAKILGLSSKEIEDLLSITDIKDVQKLKDIFIKNKDKFIKGKYMIDMRSVGAGIAITGKEFEVNFSYYTSLENMLQDLLHYDVVVVAHGTNEKEIIRKNKDYEDSKGINGIDKTPLEIFEEIEDKIYDMVDKDEASYFIRCYKKGFNKNRKYIDYNMFPKNNDECFKDFMASEYLHDFNKLFKAANDISNSYVNKYSANYKYENDNTTREKDNQWFFEYPITYNGKTYDKVIDFVRDAKRDGAKKIKLYSCNPGHYSLPDDLKDGVVFSKNCVWIEQEIDYANHQLISEQELHETPELYALYLLEKNLIEISKENNIDYYNDYLLEQTSNEILSNYYCITEDGIINKAFDKLLDFVVKVIATIINLVKKLISIIKNFFNKIKDLIQGRKQGTIPRKIKYSYAVIESAKVIEAEANSQEDLKKSVLRSCKTISNELKQKSDLQLKIIKEIKKQVEAEKKKSKISLGESYISEAVDLNRLNAYHLEIVNPEYKDPKNRGGWDGELYSKTMDQAIINDIRYKWSVKNKPVIKAHVYTAGEDLKAIYLGIIIIDMDWKNDSFTWKWFYKEEIKNDIFNTLTSHPIQ